MVSLMRLLLPVLALGLIGAPGAQAASGRVSKVLSQFIDEQGLHTLSPSLFERDAYQARLRERPALRSAIAFRVKWNARAADWTQVKLRLEACGLRGNVLQTRVLEQQVGKPGWFGSWTSFTLAGESYKSFGEVVSWRASLWEGDKLLGEHKSFLWQ